MVFGLFRKDDPSVSWPEDVDGDVVLDLRTFTLNNVPFGAPAAELESFGRPANPRPFKAERFEYARTGVVIEAEDGKVSCFGVPLVDAPGDATGSCRLTVVMPNGTHVTVDGGSDPLVLLAHLPPPGIADEDEQERWIEFDLGQHKLELEAAPQDGALRRINCFPKRPPGCGG